MAASPHPSATLPVLAAVLALAAARAADGPEATREDTGQAYVTPIGPHLG